MKISAIETVRVTEHLSCATGTCVRGSSTPFSRSFEAGIILPETRRALDIGRSMGTRQRRAMHHARLLRMR